MTNRPQKRPTPPSEATSASAPTIKKPKILTTPSGIALPQKHWFDPWNSSATGHQRAENNLAGSTSWRDSRNLKLGAQYEGGRGGGKRVADTVGAGSEEWGKDGRKVNGDWRIGAKGLRGKGQQSLLECVKNERRIGEKDDGSRDGVSETGRGQRDEDEELEKVISASLLEHDASIRGHTDRHTDLDHRAKTVKVDEDVDDDLERAIAASLQDQHPLSPSQPSQHDLEEIPPSYQTDCEPHTALEDEDNVSDTPKQIFRNLVFYINGSTAPLVSDHRLKYLLSSHGGSLSISHMRKQVTHVIIGNPHNHQVKGGGAGGALASSKIQKEIARTRGKGVKFVGVGWVLESVKAGKRVSESEYENVKVGGAGQGSVFDKFRTKKPGLEAGIVKKGGEDMTDEELGIV